MRISVPQAVSSLSVFQTETPSLSIVPQPPLSSVTTLFPASWFRKPDNFHTDNIPEYCSVWASHWGSSCKQLNSRNSNSEGRAQRQHIAYWRENNAHCLNGILLLLTCEIREIFILMGNSYVQRRTNEEMWIEEWKSMGEISRWYGFSEAITFLPKACVQTKTTTKIPDNERHCTVTSKLYYNAQAGWEKCFKMSFPCYKIKQGKCKAG